MDKKLRFSSAAVRCVSGMLLAFGLAYALNTMYSLEVPVYFLLAAVVAAQALILAFDHVKGKGAFWITLGVILALLYVVPAILGVHVNEIIRDAFAWMRGSFTWLGEYEEKLSAIAARGTLTQTTYIPKPEPEFWRCLFLAGLVILASSIVFYPLTKYFPSRLALAVLVFAALIVCAVTGHDLNSVTLVCALIYLSFSVIELCNRQLDRRRSDKKPFSALFLYPVCFLLALGAILLPAKEEPIKWEFFTNLFEGFTGTFDAIGDRFRIWFGAVPADFTISYADVNLSGKSSTLDARTGDLIMKIRPNATFRSNLYLRGSTKSEYTGTGWEDRSAELLENEAVLEAYEAMYSVRRADLVKEIDEDIYHRLTLDIEYTDLVTKSMLYSPLYMLARNDKNVSFEFSGANIRFHNFQRDGWDYEQIYFETNWGSPTMQAHLRSLDDFDYDSDNSSFYAYSFTPYSVFREINGSFMGLDKEVFNENFRETLKARADAIDELYLQLPRSLPPRVSSLSYEICGDCETKYDKIRAIEAYFAENGYEYSLSPDALPEDRDFTDWMLFDEKSGYCTYYATAATVLLRCAGIPARYVEGVRIDRKFGSLDTYQVSGVDMHAWCEAYLEGYGWIVVDATPGYGGSGIEEWTRKIINYHASASPVEEEIPPIPEEPEKTETPIELEEQISPEELARLEAEKRAAQRRLWMIVSIALVALVLLGLIIGYAVYKQSRRKSYRSASDSDKIRLLMRDILLYAGASGEKRGENETVLEYADRLGESCDLSDMDFRTAAMLYLRIRYSRDEATHMDVVSLYRYRRDLRKHVLRTSPIGEKIRMRFYETF